MEKAEFKEKGIQPSLWKRVAKQERRRFMNQKAEPVVEMDQKNLTRPSTENQTSQQETESSHKNFDRQIPMFLGPGAVLEGEIQFGDDVSVWHNAVIRTESAPIPIGSGSNIQDGCVLHTDPGYPIMIGKNVTIGHGAIVHGAVLEDDCLIGMGAVLLNGAHIRKGAMVGAGAVVGEGKEIGPGKLALGVPARIMRDLRPEEIEQNRENARHYVKQARMRLHHMK